MPTPAGRFIWYELMTPDPDAIAPFYAAVAGWTIGAADPASPAGKDYRMIGRADGKSAGGVLRLTPDMEQHGARPLWLGYLHTVDVDRSARDIAAEGGAIQMPATDIPHVGRIAMVTDPQGVPFYLMAPTPPPNAPDAVSDVFAGQAAQRVNWNELASPDLTAAKSFYGRHFGFAFNEVMPMGPLGDYCFIDHGGERIGAIMQRQDDMPPAAWLFYVGVPSIAAATRAIEAQGGTVLMAPHEVPTGAWIVVAADPAGAVIGFTGPKGE